MRTDSTDRPRTRSCGARLVALALTVSLITIGAAHADPASASVAPYPYSQTFALHSLAGSSKVIYLDFDGYTSAVETDLAYDLDGVAGFSNAEQDVIQLVWARVGENYSAFDVDVTTQDPGTAALVRSDANDPVYGVRVLVTNGGNGGLITDCLSSAGCQGLGFIGGFGDGAVDPGTVILAQRLSAGNAKALAQAITHEVGHTLGLFHNTTSPATPLWSAVMYPVSASVPISQFTTTASQDDYAVMSAHGVTSRNDDYGNSWGTSFTLNGPTFNVTGVIVAPTDTDWFNFTVPVGAGALNASVTPSVHTSMLDTELTLYDNNLALVALSNPPVAVVNADIATGLDASFVNLVLAPGRYYMRVRGVESSDYTNYGSIGTYTISGGWSVAVACQPGTYSTTGNLPCTPAPPGSYVSGSGAVGATPCLPGSFSAQLGSTACTTAPKGSYVASAGASSAALCSPGFFSDSVGATTCTAAPNGSYVNSAGASLATPCAPGSYSAIQGSTACILAPIGSYVRGSGATNATPCPPGTTTTAIGATACTASDTTPPVVTALVTGGTIGTNGWYKTGPITITWTVTDNESAVTSTSCVGDIVSTDTAGTQFACTATSLGGTASKTITVKLDSTKPVIAYTGNAGTYGILANVAITCAAADQLAGLDSNTCTGLSGPAWTFGPGSHTVTATATDKAGNSDTASTTFTITAKPADLCTLTVQFVQSSPAFRALVPQRQTLVTGVAQAACAIVSRMTPKLSPTAKARLVTQYNQFVETITTQGWLSVAQSTTLQNFAATI